MTFTDDFDEPLVRPFFLTRGRTEADIPVEAMVLSATDAPGRGVRMGSEYRDILELCVQAQAVAEIAALLRLPLGVARVLVSDLVAEGLVDLAGQSGGDPDLAFLDRIINAVERL